MNDAPKTDRATCSRRLIVRVSEAHYARILANAKTANLTLSEYVRRAAVDGEIIVERESAYGMSLASQLRHIGINLNQLTRDYNIHGEYPPELAGVCEKLELILDRILRTA